MLFVDNGENRENAVDGTVPAPDNDEMKTESEIIPHLIASPTSNNNSSTVKFSHRSIPRYRYGDPPLLSSYQNYKYPFLAFEVATNFSLIRSFIYIIVRWSTLLTLVLSVGSVLLFNWLEWRSDMPLSITAAGIILPISFGITFTFQRRLVALQDLASMKASALSIYIASREWAPREVRGEMSKRVKAQLHLLLHKIAKYLAHKRENVDDIYQDFDRLFRMMEELRSSDKWILSVISRSYQYVRFMMNDFERLRVVHDFGTPSAFRGFAFVYLTFFSIFFAPLFANIAHEYGLWAGIYCSALTSVMLMSLNHIIHDNEDPFDGLGIDDLNFELIEEAPLHMWREVVDSVGP